MSEKRIPISLSKFLSLLEKHNYTLVSTYCVGDDVYFIESRTPRLQKTFVISVPQKYKMTCNTETHKRFQINPSREPSVRQIDYLTEIKGPLLECDLLAISSTDICIYRNNGTTGSYTIGDVIREEEAEEEERDDIEEIERDVKKMTKLIEEEASDEEDELTSEDLKTMKVVNSSKTGGVELEFEDSEGAPIEDAVPDLMEKEFEEGIDEGDEDVEEEDVEEVEHQTPAEESIVAAAETPKKRSDNSLPPNIEDSGVTLGLIYYSIDLQIFYRKVAENLETAILACYDTLDDNENTMRENKAVEIVESALKLSEKVRLDMKGCREKEMELKAQILKLSAVLNNTDVLRAKVATDPAKFSDVKPDLDRIVSQTKTTIFEINVALLRMRDNADDMLSYYQTSLDDMIATALI